MKLSSIITLSLLASVAISSSACKSVNSRFFGDNTSYAEAKELPALKFPPHAVAVSDRYEIPTIPNKTDAIIEVITPPV